MNNTVAVIDESVKDKLISQGFRLIEETKDINGKTIWVLNPCGLSFDICESEANKIIVSKGFGLRF